MVTQENSASQKQSERASRKKMWSVVPNAAKMLTELRTDLSGKTAKLVSVFHYLLHFLQIGFSSKILIRFKLFLILLLQEYRPIQTMLYMYHMNKTKHNI